MSTSCTQSSRISVFAGLTLLALFATPVMAQNQGGPGGGRDPAQFRQMMIDRMKEALGANDEEMQALQPKIEKIMQLQRDSNAGGMRMLFNRGGGQGGPGGPGGPGGGQPSDQPLSPVQQKAKELKDAVDANAPAADVKAKMQALRDARVAAKADLAKAQGELKELLTQKQEAVLLMMGMLE